MKRNEVPQHLKWKLEDIFATNEAWEASFNEVSVYLDRLVQYKGKLNNKDTLLEFLKLSDECDLCLERVYTYAHMRLNEDSAHDLYQGYAKRATGLLAKTGAALSWVSPELNQIEEAQLLDWASKKEFSDYDYSLRELVRRKKHILSEKEERILALAADVNSSYSDIFDKFDNIEVPFQPVVVNGEEKQLTHGTYSLFLQNKDANVRKAAFENMYTAFKSFINTLAALYGGNVKKGVFNARARGHQSCLAAAMYNDNVPTQVYENLIEAVGLGTPAVHRYVALRNRLMGGNIHMYDLYVPIIEGAELKMPYDEAFDLCVEALAPLGEEYLKVFKSAKEERWIDVCETENKRSGAYQWGPTDVHPFVLLNYQETTHDIFTVAHEMGHAMHSYYSKKTQPYSKAGYAIFVAEVASTVNEVLLLKHLIAHTQDKTLKKYLLSYYLDMFRTTLFRQTMFAEFEASAHEMCEKGIPLTATALSDMYYALNKKYYGESVIHDDFIRYEWARIPHFYNAFYVYKYSTGITSAISIATSILNGEKDALKNYLKFLSSGGNGSPYDILKIAGVDLADKKPYQKAIAEFDTVLSELEKLV